MLKDIHTHLVEKHTANQPEFSYNINKNKIKINEPSRCNDIGGRFHSLCLSLQMA